MNYIVSDQISMSGIGHLMAGIPPSSSPPPVSPIYAPTWGDKVKLIDGLWQDYYRGQRYIVTEVRGPCAYLQSQAGVPFGYMLSHHIEPIIAIRSFTAHHFGVGEHVTISGSDSGIVYKILRLDDKWAEITDLKETIKMWMELDKIVPAGVWEIAASTSPQMCTCDIVEIWNSGHRPGCVEAKKNKR